MLLTPFYDLNAPVFTHSYSHRQAIDKAKFEEIYALDEPAQNELAYAVDLNQTYKGLLTVQANGSWRDYDRYRFWVPGRGVVTAAVTIADEAAGTSRFLSPNGEVLSARSGAGSFQTFLPSGGDQYLEVEGTSGSYYWRSYVYNLSFCPLPEDPIISMNGRSAICEGEMVTLSATPGYTDYSWYKDGNRLSQTGAQLTVDKAGTYQVEGAKCGVIRSSTSQAAILVNPKPSVPTINLSADGSGLVSSESLGNQWYLNDMPIVGATAPIVPYSSLSSGTITLKVTSPQGCSNTSAPFLITATEPIMTADLFTVSPNPVSTRIRVKTTVLTPYSLRVNNLLGQTIWSKPEMMRNQDPQIDVSNWPRGLYLLRLESESKSQTLKVLLQ